MTRRAIRTLARRWLALGNEITGHDRDLARLTLHAAPSILAEHGAGTDVTAKLLIAAGDNLNDELPRAPDWTLALKPGELSVADPRGVLLYLGPIDDHPDWTATATVAGEVAVVTGITLGTRNADPWPAFDEAVSAGRVVGAILSITPAGTPGATRALPKVGRNDQCPCGNGRKYKHCHGQ